jgi:chemotaxis response regulator CheB
MKFVLCDDDLMLRSMVDGIVTGLGHEVIGVADTTSEATSLIQTGRPDVVIVDMTVGANTDFDVVATAIEVGAQTVVFSFHTDAERLSSYEPRPVAVAKPDFVALEEVLGRLGAGSDGAAPADRRRRPTRAAQGPQPMGLHDAAAFYEALNNAQEGDTLVAIDLVGDLAHITDSDSIAQRIALLVRQTDRLLVTSTSLKVLLVGGGSEGTASLMGRLGHEAALPPGSRMHSVVVGAGEAPSAAFERLKQASDQPA